jgi:hypothetical protein
MSMSTADAFKRHNAMYRKPLHDAKAEMPDFAGVTFA